MRQGPLLLIGAGSDGGVDLQPHYYAAARQPKSYWKIPEAGHTAGFQALQQEYTRRVLGIFDSNWATTAPSDPGHEAR